MKLRTIGGAAILAAIFLGCVSGCAVAQTPAGEYVLGFGVGSEPGSAIAVGSTIGDALSLFGVPGGKLIGGFIGTALISLGIGVRNKKKAADESWDEAERKAEQRAEAERARAAAEFNDGILYAHKGLVSGVGVPAGAVAPGVPSTGGVSP